jgi:hypothetical protein
VGADFLRFTHGRTICRYIGAVEQALDRVNVLRLSFKFKLKVGSLKFGRQSQVWLCQLKCILCFV